MSLKTNDSANKIETAIIGAGAAGMAAALKLYDKGVRNIVLFDRNPYLGGILKQCIHLGFGLSFFGEELSGPQYAARLSDEINRLKIPYKLNTMVTEVTADKVITASSSDEGIKKFKADTIIFAVGCRERTRENLEIAGSRPSGIYTAGLAQTLININNYRIGRRVVIQGSGDIGLIMARRMAIEGYEVVAVLERLPYLNGLIRNKVQCLDHFNIPLYLSAQISEICGPDRVTGVNIESFSASVNVSEALEKRFIECDTVLFVVGLIPELELANKAKIKLENDFCPEVNSGFESGVTGIFFCGNCLHINDLADNASIEGELAAQSVCNYLSSLDKFKSSVKNEKPYGELQKNLKYTKEFFKELKDGGQTVCIICSNSCLLDKDFKRCRRGIEYFKNYSSEPRQRLVTSVFDKATGKNIPIVSVDTLDVRDFRIIRKADN